MVCKNAYKVTKKTLNVATQRPQIFIYTLFILLYLVIAQFFTTFAAQKRLSKAPTPEGE